MDDNKSAFIWTTFDGNKGKSQIYPGPDADIMELILNKPDTIRHHESYPEHEIAMQNLPPRLEVLRMSKCRIRTWPNLPLTIREMYAQENDFFHIPADMSQFTQLIVLELTNGRLEDFITILPPTIARANVSSNALGIIRIQGEWPTSLDVLHAYDNPSRMKKEPPQYIERIITIKIRVQPVYNNVANGPMIVDNEPMIVDNEPIVYERPVVPTRTIVYNNKQNVHDSGVQSSARKNLQYLASFSQNRSADAILKSMASSPFIKIFCKKSSLTISPIIKYEIKLRLSQPYSMHGYHVKTIIDGLWTKICSMEGDARITAVKRFEEEIKDGMFHCTNGFMVRLCNVLMGLDENIKMQLNSSEILQARVPQTMKTKREAGGWKEGEEPWQWSRDCFIETVKDLNECEEYKLLTRQQWLTHFLEGFEDELVKDSKDDDSLKHQWKEWGLPYEPWAIAYIQNKIRHTQNKIR